MEDHEGSPQTDYSGANIDPDENSANFDVGYETYYNNTWNVVNWTYEHIDFPCGTSGYCLNGYSYGASEWSDNKP